MFDNAERVRLKGRPVKKIVRVRDGLVLYENDNLRDLTLNFHRIHDQGIILGEFSEVSEEDTLQDYIVLLEIKEQDDLEYTRTTQMSLGQFSFQFEPPQGLTKIICTIKDYDNNIIASDYIMLNEEGEADFIEFNISGTQVQTYKNSPFLPKSGKSLSIF